MQTERKVEYDDVVVRPDVRAAIRRHVAQLEALLRDQAGLTQGDVKR